MGADPAFGLSGVCDGLKKERSDPSYRYEFPQPESSGKGGRVPEILEAILKVFPLDTYVEHPVNLMEVMPGDDVETPIWDTYKEIIRKYDDRGDATVGNIERFAFYDEAKTAYCIISTSEKALYANIMLQKGVVINN